MTDQERALEDLARKLDGLGLAYMVIGGLANAVWGQPRSTLDVDLTIWFPEIEVESFVEAFRPEFTVQVKDPVGFAHQTRVLPFRSVGGVRIDLLLGLLPFEEQAIRRAVAVTVGETDVCFCTAEDLILLKIISDRGRDLGDVQGIMNRRFSELDLGYLEPRLAELASLLEKPEILERWERWKPA